MGMLTFLFEVDYYLYHAPSEWRGGGGSTTTAQNLPSVDGICITQKSVTG